MDGYRLIVLSGIVLGLGWFPHPVKAQGLRTEKVLPLALAAEAAEAALAACEEQGYHVSVAIVDGDGVVRVLMRGDGAGPHTADSSGRKAYTAASLGRPTGDLVKIVAGNPANEGLRNMNEKILILAGGLPVKTGEEVIGGIGVGGAPGGEKDETCAQAGLDKIKDRLK
ncbi:MAG TPA: heme-binding protein [Nitrospiria bacterium]|jgi:uncharacterized protein GlcG (DUF336 family)|nr:heme-binding protein [Nitrospiria bacterium]